MFFLALAFAETTPKQVPQPLKDEQTCEVCTVIINAVEEYVSDPTNTEAV